MRNMPLKNTGRIYKAPESLQKMKAVNKMHRYQRAV